MSPENIVCWQHEDAEGVPINERILVITAQGKTRKEIEEISEIPSQAPKTAQR